MINNWIICSHDPPSLNASHSTRWGISHNTKNLHYMVHTTVQQRIQLLYSKWRLSLYKRNAFNNYEICYSWLFSSFYIDFVFCCRHTCTLYQYMLKSCTCTMYNVYMYKCVMYTNYTCTVQIVSQNLDRASKFVIRWKTGCPNCSTCYNSSCVLHIKQGVHLANRAYKRHPKVHVLLANTMVQYACFTLFFSSSIFYIWNKLIIIIIPLSSVHKECKFQVLIYMYMTIDITI